MEQRAQKGTSVVARRHPSLSEGGADMTMGEALTLILDCAHLVRLEHISNGNIANAAQVLRAIKIIQDRKTEPLEIPGLRSAHEILEIKTVFENVKG